jgi:fatty acid desaturase
MSDIDTTHEEDEFRKLMRAYAGFQMATALVVATKVECVHWSDIVLLLFAVSIPSTVAYGGFHTFTPKYKKRNPKFISFVCGFCAYVVSIAALALLLASASIIAGLVFAGVTLFWVGVTAAIRPKPGKTEP